MILFAENISKSFYNPEQELVLKNIAFKVDKGEFISIIGKSGSGKSTLLYILSTMDTKYEGKLSIDGIELNGKSQNFLATFRNQNIGFVFQFHYLLFEFSVLENVILPAMKFNKYNKNDIKNKAMELLKWVEMDKYYNKTVIKLSGGEQQRIAIARALINEPKILFADEPTGNLDSYNSDIILNLFKKFRDYHHQTIITVTHDKDFANKCDRCIELKDGFIINDYRIEKNVK